MDKSQLLILGNGFDLHCGLKSSYKDFFRSEILDTIGESFELKQLQAGVSGFWENLLLEYYKIYGKDDYAWCDIERIIKDTLSLIYFGNDDNKKSINQGLCCKAYKYLHSTTIGLGLDKLKGIDKLLFEYCIKFLTINGGDFKESLNLLIKYLFQQLNNLEQRFCKYLKNQIVNPNNDNEINKKYIINALHLLAQLTGMAYLEDSKLKDDLGSLRKKYIVDVFDNLNNVFILNFNYTALFDILGIAYPCFYNNVHGKLCNDRCVTECNASNIIFGIDDNLIQSQSASSDLRLFSKTYRKMLNSDKFIMTLPPNNGNPIEIKFYGHSLSEADYSYFQSIFDYYDLYGNSNVSLTFYYSIGFQNHDAVYKLISAYGKSFTNKEQGKNLIHKLLLENRLKIQTIGTLRHLSI